MSLGRLSLPTVLAGSISVLIIVVVGSFTLGTAFFVKRTAEDAAVARADFAIKAASAEIRGFFTGALNQSQTLALAVEAQNGVVNDRRVLDETVRRTISRAPDSYYGAWVVMRPDELGGADVERGSNGTDSAGIFSSYWVRNGVDVKRNNDLASYDTNEDYTQDYYTKPERTKRATIIDPYVDPSNGTLMASATAPVLRGDAVVGVAGVDLSLSEFSRMVNSFNPFQAGEISLVAGRIVVASTQSDRVGKPSAADADDGGQLLAESDDTMRLRMPVTVDAAGTTWSLSLAVPRRVLMADVDRMLLRLFVGGAVTAVVGVAAGWIFGRRIARPVLVIGGGMDELVDGRLSTSIEVRSMFPEIRRMAACLERFRADALEMHRLKEEQEGSAARLAEEKRQAMEELADRFDRAVGGIVTQVSAAATELQASASTLTSIAEETSTQSMAVASASELASSNVETVSASAEELATSVTEIARQVEQSSKIATHAVGQANDTDTEVNSLAQAVEKIGSIVGLINDIAGQTNLLALNATIEAARAGMAGRGFAVVAAEVKGLAEQTARATAEIGAQIAAVQASTRQATVRIKEIGVTIQDISRISTIVAGAVEEQSAATREIARNVLSASQRTQEVSNNISGVTRAAEQSSAASTQILNASDELSRQSALLRKEVDTFLANIRAG